MDGLSVNIHQTDTLALLSGTKSAAFGGAALIGALLFASGMPIIRRDILQVGSYSSCADDDLLTMSQKVPVIGSYFITEVHPADNVSL
jgi:hypothetical protein